MGIRVTGLGRQIAQFRQIIHLILRDFNVLPSMPGAQDFCVDVYTHNCYLPVLQYCRTELGIFVETKMSLKRYCYELLYSLNFIPF